jgi:hypothetical protein
VLGSSAQHSNDTTASTTNVSAPMFPAVDTLIGTTTSDPNPYTRDWGNTAAFVVHPSCVSTVDFVIGPPTNHLKFTYGPVAGTTITSLGNALGTLRYELHSVQPAHDAAVRVVAECDRYKSANADTFYAFAQRGRFGLGLTYSHWRVAPIFGATFAFRDLSGVVTAVVGRGQQGVRAVVDRANGNQVRVVAGAGRRQFVDITSVFRQHLGVEFSIKSKWVDNGKGFKSAALVSAQHDLWVAKAKVLFSNLSVSMHVGRALPQLNTYAGVTLRVTPDGRRMPIFSPGLVFRYESTSPQ